MSDGPWTTIPNWVSSAAEPAVADRLRSDLEEFCRSYVEEATSHAWDNVAQRESYLIRLWTCVDEHGQRLSAAKRCSWSEVLKRLEQGDLGYERQQSNILRDVCFAQALVNCENHAAQWFERELMPLVRRVAQRVAGLRGIEMVDNFLAELILPRDQGPARMASYRGRTSLSSWVSAVTSNHCVSKSRVRRDSSLDENFDPIASAPGESSADSRGCEELLQPVFRHAVSSVPAEDRLLLKLLVLDDVPQQNVARALGIHSGNVTRRRQKAAERIWQQVRGASQAKSQSGPVQECLELVLAGDDRELRATLGGVLAESLPDSVEDERRGK